MPGETGEERALRLAAAGPRAYCRRVRSEIRRNHVLAGHAPEGRPNRLERLVAHIESHLFEESLSVGSACRAAGIADTSIAVDLRAYTRYTVDELIDRLRVQAAVHLLVFTQIQVLRIAGLLGFKTYRTFVRTYKNWTGKTPEATRRQEIDPCRSIDFGSFRVLLGIGAGELATGEARALRKELGRLYPEVFCERQETPSQARAALAMPGLDAEAFERLQAAELWPRLAELAFAEQRKLVRSWTFWTPGPFDFLHRKSREEGRRERKRGVEVARLALDALDDNEDRIGFRVHELRAEGWSWLANAKRLDLDFSAAEASFHRAEGVLDAYNLRNSRAAGTFYTLKGTLRMFERRLEEAFDLFDQALPPLASAGDVHSQVRTLVQRTAALDYADRFDEVEPTLRKAVKLLQAAPDERLSIEIAYAMTTYLVRAGDFERAETYYQSVATELEKIEEPVWRNLIRWAEALMDHGLGRLEAAEEKYLSSRRGFRTLNQFAYEAFVSLDLVVLYSETGNSAKVLEISPSICHFFEGLRLYDETLAALQLLHDAITRAEVTVEVLREVRSSLWRDPFASAA